MTCQMCQKQLKSGFHALNVCTVASVDLNLVADIDEEGNAHLSTSLDSSGFEGVGGSVALDSGFGVGDFKDNACGHLASKDGVGSSVYHSFADVTFLEELDTFDAFAGENDFFPCLGVEEMVAHIIFIRVLVGTTLNAHFINFHAGVPGFVNYATGLDVLKLGADKSGTFTGLNVEKLDDEEVVAVDVEAHTIFEISCSCHCK